VTKAGKTYATNGTIVYAINLEPAMSKLKLEKNYKIYQQMNRGSIIQDILFSAGINPDMLIQNNGKMLEMSVMYNQSRLSYLQHLVEELGIAYFFNGNNIVFTDNPNNYLESGATLLFVGADFNISNINTESQSYAFSYYIAQKSMASKFTTAAYDFQSAITITNSVGSGQTEKYSFNFTDTSLSDVTTTSNISAGRENSANNLHNGISNNPLISAGYKFNVSVGTGSKSAPLAGNYVATEINHALNTSADGNCLIYANSFSSLQSSIIFKPTIKVAKVKAAGITTAIVVGPAGETKYTDANGRIKIQFHWDQQGTNDESSSAWVRVATPVDRLNDKLLYVPLIGTEVIVSFLNGDPSLPVVTGSVYNKDYQPPLALPANKFANGGQANTDLPL
jgi:type VI secretion system secreted protein VgrG